MRHRARKNSSFGRHRGPREALVRGLVRALVEQERIKTTLPKARYIRPLVEKAVTIGKKNSVHAHRQLLSLYPWSKTIYKIMKDLAPRFKDRNGGYTRIIKLGFRSGDQAPLAYLEFVDYQAAGFTPSSSVKETTSKLESDKKDKKTKKLAKDKKAAKTKEDAKDKKNVKDKKGVKGKKDSVSKKIKRQQTRKINKRRKKIRQMQQKSRRANRA